MSHPSPKKQKNPLNKYTKFQLNRPNSFRFVNINDNNGYCGSFQIGAAVQMLLPQIYNFPCQRVLEISLRFRILTHIWRITSHTSIERT